MQEQFDTGTFAGLAANITAVFTYFSGIGTFLGQVMNYLDGHAAGVGAAVAVLTYLSNIIFNCINRQELIRRAAVRLASQAEEQENDS